MGEDAMRANAFAPNNHLDKRRIFFESALYFSPKQKENRIVEYQSRHCLNINVFIIFFSVP